MLVSIKSTLLSALPFFIFASALTLVTYPMLLALDLSRYALLGLLMTSPLLLTSYFLFIAGGISTPFHRAIIGGVFPRDLSNPVYMGRRVYGVCLNAVMHFSLVYGLIMQTKVLRQLFFLLFGYDSKTGSLDFTIYHDTWFRDLKLLTFGKKAYIASNSVIGTNLCLTDGNIMVGRIKIGENSHVGQNTMIGPGARMGDNSATGIRTIIGVRSRIGNHVELKAASNIAHAVKVGNGCTLQPLAYLGSKVEIGDNINIPAYSHVKDGTIIRTQEDVDQFVQNDRNEMKQTILASVDKMRESRE